MHEINRKGVRLVIIKIMKSFIMVLIVVFTGISICHVGGETAEIMPYEISVIYKYQNSISAVDIVKNEDFSGKDDVLLVVSKNQNGQTMRVQAVFLEENLSKGTHEITISDFIVEDGQTIFVTVWDSLEILKPMTNGGCPKLTIEPQRIIGDAEEWEVAANGKRIVSYKGNETDVIIPNYIN